MPYARISDNLKRAVIACEDAGFAEHSGVEWDALEKAWERNQRAEAQRRAGRAARQARRGAGARHAARRAAPKVVGGSTITQQLAKNLFLGGERTLLRKGQEFVLTLMLEALLDKRAHPRDLPQQRRMGRRRVRRRGGGAALLPRRRARARRPQAARLAVMLPAPKRFEKRPGSPYVAGPRGDDRGAHGRGRRALSASARRRLAWRVDGFLECRRWPARSARRSPPPPPAWWSRRAWNTAPAKRRAARDCSASTRRARRLPDNDAVEDEVRDYLALFCADTAAAPSWPRCARIARDLDGAPGRASART